ncbi:MAG TPA: ABC-F family ATP-binding cassette domain-containing protein [Verrucomicrobiales bacterium]|nr:ABC-F family ATP-binding cassette domain-containing protein [Verrucomicrobiales bacterium]
MLSLSRVAKRYAGRVLFEDVSLQLNRGDRVGLVGPNGAGKSTLFGIILGSVPPDEGEVSLERGLRLGYLPQETAAAGDETVLELATAVSPEIARLRELLSRLEHEHRTHEEDYHEARVAYDSLGGFTLEPRARRILAGLAFRPQEAGRPARELSGGWIMRAHLARLLVMEPDLLMLDEPTNHLDLESLGWLQQYLQQYPGAILLISHDRAFLNALCTSTIDIEQGRLNRYRGNYDSYIEQKEARYAQVLAAFENQQREIARLTRFVDRFRAKASKAAQAQSKIKQLERMQRIELPVRPGRALQFRFPQPKRAGQRAVTLEGVQQGYGDVIVYRRLDFSAERGERIVLVGPNGAGKSTLLKILAGIVPIQGGNRSLGHNVTLGYYSQHRTDMLASSKTVLQTVLGGPHAIGEEHARTLLGSFLFRGDDVFKQVSVLSGGEKSRLALIRFLLDPPNLLLMDEPTTHLDMPSIDALLTALRQYEGTLVFISHDVHFIRLLADSVVHIDAGKLTRYAGDYDYYLDKTGADSARAALTAGQSQLSPPAPSAIQPASRIAEASGRKSKERKRLEAEGRRQRAEQRRTLETELSSTESRILALETRKKELHTLLGDPATYAGRGQLFAFNRELEEVDVELDSANNRWHSLAESLSAALT